MPIPTAQEVANRVYGAWRLLRLDPGGMAFFDDSVDGFWKSFFAAALVAPAHVITLLLTPSEREPLAGLLAIALIQAIAYVASWVTFPVVFHALVDLLDRRDRFVVYIAVFNWAKVIQMGLLLPAILLGALGILPKGVTDLLIALVTFAVLGYQWFLTKVALDVTGLAASGIVALDLVLGLMIIWYANTMIF